MFYLWKRNTSGQFQFFRHNDYSFAKKKWKKSIFELVSTNAWCQEKFSLKYLVELLANGSALHLIRTPSVDLSRFKLFHNLGALCRSIISAPFIELKLLNLALLCLTSNSWRNYRSSFQTITLKTIVKIQLSNQHKRGTGHAVYFRHSTEGSGSPLNVQQNP